MNPQAQDLNSVIESKSKVVFEMLSERGKNIFFPKKGILGQTADAKGTKINATIGAAIEDDGTPMRLACIDSKLDIDPALAFPYAPSYGRADLRKRWQEMLAEKNPALTGKAISLPVVTNALTHGISMVGYLFVDKDQEVLVPSLFWGNYNLALINGYGAKIVTYNLFKGSGLDLEAMESALMAEGTKKVIILNFPNNPSGYSPTKEEMIAISEIVKKAAQAGKRIVAVSDDAYFGLVYEPGVETQSPFAFLSDIHENVLAVKVDGPTKEDYAWGFRVGFITYGIKGGDQVLYAGLEEKTGGAVRGNISNASNLSQSLLLQAYNSPEYHTQKQEKYETLKVRYNKVKEIIKDSRFKDVFTILPFNSGYFMCLRLKEGIDGEEIRHLLISKYGIGVINLNNVLRVAFAAVSVADIEPLFEGIYQACKELQSN
jgi:aspartate/methionine/tyrosine aminotransferase